MINQKIQDAINAQINREQFSAQLYLAMSAHCEAKSFRGFAHWLRLQAQEETLHAMKLVTFLLDRGGRLELKAIAAPPTEFGKVTELFQKVLEHEREITANINGLFELSRAGEGSRQRDHPPVVRDRAGRGGGQRRPDPGSTARRRRAGRRHLVPRFEDGQAHHRLARSFRSDGRYAPQSRGCPILDFSG